MHIHILGICGTFMGGVAQLAAASGHRVTGCDANVYPPMSDQLRAAGVDLIEGFDASQLALQPDTFVIGNAISRGNPLLEAILDQDLPYVSGPQWLAEHVLQGRWVLGVAGTHGKTTTTSLLAWVFEHNGLNPSYLIGGLANNFGQGARFTDSEWFIIEGDEYDTAFFDKRSKFVHYLPEVAIINNVEFDHADIFENLAAIQTSFRRLINLIPRNGLLLANGDDANLAPLLNVKHCPVRRFGLDQANELQATGLTFAAEVSQFEVQGAKFSVPLIGELNVRNALAVVACARHCGLSDAQIQSGFDTFQGIRRRQEIRGESNGITVIDDFGHHPTAIRETVRALRHRFAGRRLWAVFEPRSNTTRRKVFQTELASALAEADCVVVAQVARLEQLPAEERLDPARLMQDIASAGRPAAYLAEVEAIVHHVRGQARPGDVVCVFSNGGFGGIHAKLLA